MATNPFNLATPLPVETTFLANNGNPNTVYNTSGTPFQNTPVRGVGSQPLTAGGTPAISPWTPANPPASMPVMPTNSAFHNPATQFWQNYAGVVRPTFSLAESGAWGNNPFAPTPSTTPPTTEPPSTPPPSSPPPVRPDQRPQDEVDLGRYSLGGNLNISGFGSNGTATVRGTNGNEFSTRPAGSVVNGLRDIVDSAARGLGFNGRDGQFDVNQFLDAVTQVFLPGDLYNANVGSWNTLNVATSLLNSFVPGLGRVATWLIDQLPEGNALRSWMQRNVVQNNVDEAIETINDAPQTTPSGGGGGGWEIGGGGGLGGFGTGLEGRTGGGGGSWRTGRVTVRPPQIV